MIVFRISRQKYKDELSGFGASLNGQRWNSKGTEIIYVAESRALANSEIAVHISLGILPKDYFMVEIEIPDSIQIAVIPDSELPHGWDFLPPLPKSQMIGDQLVAENKYAVLKVPSVVVKGDYNFIINPMHKDFNKIRILNTEAFPFDSRYFNG